MRLWILLEPSVLASLFWWSAGRGRRGYRLGIAWCKSRFCSSTDTWGTSDSAVLLGRSGSSGSTLSLHGRYSVWDRQECLYFIPHEFPSRGRFSPLLLCVGGKAWPFTLPSLTSPQREVGWVSHDRPGDGLTLQGMESSDSPGSLLWQYPSWERVSTSLWVSEGGV